MRAFRDAVETLTSDDTKFRNLLQDLEAGGGRAVAALLRRAAQGVKVLRLGGMSAEICRDACWEKLHTGNWAEVSVMWRDAYTAASLLCACATALAAAQPAAVAQLEAPAVHKPILQPASVAEAPTSQPAAAPSTAHGPAADGSAPDNRMDSRTAAAAADSTARKTLPESACRAAEEALRQLDIAALLGGPLFRPLLDACIAELQEHLAAAAAAALPDGEPVSKRQKRPQSAASSSLDGEQRRVAGDAGPVAGSNGVAPSLEPEVPLPPGALQSVLVQRQPLPSLESFLGEHMCAAGGGHPVIITGGIEHWPARQRWGDLSYLRTAAGARTVPVEVGQHYLATHWGQQLMTVSEFIDRHILTHGASDVDSGPGQERGYLAQHELFEQIPALRADICEPDYCALGAGGRVTVNAWFGPPGTVTPPHTDPYHNLLAQVVGRKYVRMYRPDATPGLYPFEEGFTTNCSQVDVDEPDAQRFPAFSSLQHYDCILEPGDMLYIPPKWWHYVKSLSVSFSVSFWWSYAGSW